MHLSTICVTAGQAVSMKAALGANALQGVVVLHCRVGIHSRFNAQLVIERCHKLERKFKMLLEEEKRKEKTKCQN